MAFGSLTTEEEHFFTWMGLCLDMLQRAERGIRDVLTSVFPTGGVLDLASLESDEAAFRRKTIGQLVVELRRRAAIHPEFEPALVSFLTDRNTFIHHFEVVRAQGDEKALLFVKSLFLRAAKLTELMAALFAAWAKRVEDQVPGFKDLNNSPALDCIREKIDLAPFLIWSRRGERV